MSTRRNDSQKAVAERLLSRSGLALEALTSLQTLWAGYGHISAVRARSADGKEVRLVLKLITPPKSSGGDEGHRRKMLSYAVEQYFYTHVAPKLPADVRVAQCVASTYNDVDADKDGLVAMLLTDLRLEFPVAGEKRAELSPTQVHSALRWLARFHASSWAWLPDKNGLGAYVLPPLEEPDRPAAQRKMWLNGGYTYLATRRTELGSLARNRRSEWARAFCTDGDKSVSERAAAFLTPRGRACETLIHGDVKSENLFTNRDGTAVAFFDFQYVGLGLGVCDLAKLLTCSVPEDMLVDGDIPDRLPMQSGEESLLREYLATLQAGVKRPPYQWDTFTRHWETALVDWCRFQASWGFWGNTEWLGARVRHILSDGGWSAWIDEELAALK